MIAAAIAFFKTSALTRYAVVAVAAVLLVGGFVWYVRHDAVKDERGRAAIEHQEETEDARKQREEAERRARSTPYGELLDRLFGKSTGQ